MNFLIVMAHDKKDSLTSYLTTYILDHINSSEQPTEFFDLYHYVGDIPFYVHDKDILKSNPFFQQTKNAIMKADRLIIVFPTYWYSTPGILKCWIDLITNYAWKFDKPMQAKARHRIKKALIVSSSIQPRWYSLLFGNLALKQVAQTLKWMGVPHLVTHEVCQVKELDNKLLQRHTKRIDSYIDWLLY